MTKPSSRSAAPRRAAAATPRPAGAPIHVAEYMTKTPVTIGSDQPMVAAHQLMREHRVRHLPVLAGGRLVGIVSDRDLHLMETLQDVDPESVLVEDAMSGEPYWVVPSTPVAEVAAYMARYKYGCALIADGGKLVGIFTTVDACRVLADILAAHS